MKIVMVMLIYDRSGGGYGGGSTVTAFPLPLPFPLPSPPIRSLHHLLDRLVVDARLAVFHDAVEYERHRQIDHIS